MAGLRTRRGSWAAAIAIAIAAAAAMTGCSFERVPGTPPTADPDAPPMDTVVIGDASSDWWNTAWNHRRKITIKNDELSGPVQGFPLLVRLPPGVGRPDGADLRFVAADQQTVLPHEIDQAGPGGAQVWVRIPDISNTGPAPALWVYYDNPAAGSTSNGQDVFGAGALYVSVHHLGPGNVETWPDATGNGHTTNNPPPGQEPTPVAGQIGGALRFDGANDSLVLEGEAAYDFTTSFTVSAWIQRQAFNAPYQAIVTKGDLTWRLHRENQTPYLGFGTYVTSFEDHRGNTNIDNNAWHHVAIVFGAATKRLFVDGQPDGTFTVGPTIATSNAPVALGYNSESVLGGQRYWNGLIDEVRISAAARDAHWIFAEHHTVTDPDFVTVGGQEIPSR